MNEAEKIANVWIAAAEGSTTKEALIEYINKVLNEKDAQLSQVDEEYAGKLADERHRNQKLEEEIDHLKGNCGLCHPAEHEERIAELEAKLVSENFLNSQYYKKIQGLEKRLDAARMTLLDIACISMTATEIKRRASSAYDAASLPLKAEPKGSHE